MIFAPTGTRTLELLKEEDNYPTFIELSIILGQPHRCLFGATSEEALRQDPLQGPFFVPPDLFATQLQWVRAAAHGNG